MILPKEKRLIVNFNDEVEVFVNLQRNFDKSIGKYVNTLIFQVNGLNKLFTPLIVKKMSEREDIPIYAIYHIMTRNEVMESKLENFIYFVIIIVNTIEESNEGFTVTLNINITKDSFYDFFFKNQRTTVIRFERSIKIPKKMADDILEFDYE